ncbi:undecaprenyl diphosphate synthase family protein [Halalkalicoccus subterraneus]|uniref:undecaprenyl diphosphate synthase family protein n=1 Tax=Halalkalicoccus subterraneus TaxID=2675002 RepID=UPI000EFC3931|nr:undecaprenyl diphosphate synthase family protein [Halalkalicoccus subterraneus]
MGLYDRYLAARIRRNDLPLPNCVAVVITERDLLEQDSHRTIEKFFEWTSEYGAERVLVYVSVLDGGVVPTIQRVFERCEAPRTVEVRDIDDKERADAPIQVSIGLGGKHEFAAAVRETATEVEAGTLSPHEIDADAIEERLIFPTDPDLVIKTGAERLSDFMIWQSVYSELHFTDVNWRDFRERDYLRAIRDYQNRQRRYGR